MDNLKSPAYPLPIANIRQGEIVDTTDYAKANGGFTKLELASLMIAQGDVSANGLPKNDRDAATYYVDLAKAVFEEANK